MTLQYSEKKPIYCVQSAKSKNLLVSDSALMVRMFTSYWAAQNSGKPNTDVTESSGRQTPLYSDQKGSFITSLYILYILYNN